MKTGLRGRWDVWAYREVGSLLRMRTTIAHRLLVSFLSHAPVLGLLKNTSFYFLGRDQSLIKFNKEEKE